MSDRCMNGHLKAESMKNGICQKCANYYRARSRVRGHFVAPPRNWEKKNDARSASTAA